MELCEIFHMEKAQLNLPLFSSSINTPPFSSPSASDFYAPYGHIFLSLLFFFFLFRLIYGRNEILILCNWFVSLYMMLSHFLFIRHNCILLCGWWTHTKYICHLFFFRSLLLPRQKSPYPNMINNDRVGRDKRYLNSKRFHLWVCIFIFVSYSYQMTISHWIYLMYLILTITLVVLIYI